jgi:hypothetical protein
LGVEGGLDALQQVGLDELDDLDEFLLVVLGAPDGLDE